MNRKSLDSYAKMPPAMANYMQNYGQHFSKAMYEDAVKGMWRVKPDGTKERMKPISIEEFEKFMNEQGVKFENDMMYDGAYVMMMARADFYGRSIEDDHHLALFVKDYIDDPDTVDGQVFNRYYADCCISGKVIDWERML